MSPSAPDPRSEAARGAVVAETLVHQQSGEWHVDISVVSADGVVRHTVNKYRSKREADIAASWIQRGANRDSEGPVNG